MDEKYVFDKEYKITGVSLYKESDEFYECLKYPGCGTWMSSYNTSSKKISLQLIGKSRGVGYIRIIMEAVPEFHDYLIKHERMINSSDKDAL